MHCLIPQPEHVGYYMNPDTQIGIASTEQILDLVNECADVIPDTSPVMMYKMDEEGILHNVNPRWLSAMWYENQEILGHRFTDFLTEECRG